MVDMGAAVLCRAGWPARPRRWRSTIGRSGARRACQAARSARRDHWANSTARALPSAAEAALFGFFSWPPALRAALPVLAAHQPGMLFGAEAVRPRGLE